MNEVERKLTSLRAVMKAQSLSAVYLRGVDWFSWVTGGGSSVVIFTSETGIAEVLVTADKAFLLTNRIERARLCDEELSGDFEILEFPWQDEGAASRWVSQLGGETVACDRPNNGYVTLPHEILRLKWIFGPEEILRYREVGRRASAAMREALADAQPDWSEQELAGHGARALWARGLDPTLVIAAGSKRGTLYRHPVAKNAPLGEWAMLVFCARGHGLYANLTRFRFFRERHQKEVEKFRILKRIESAALAASIPGATLSDVYRTLEQAYITSGLAGEIDLHHQGGITGYLARERIASANTPDVLSENMALAFNPSVVGAKVEDTVLLTANGFENLTKDET